MISREVVIVNKLGLHARAAAKFVTLASEFSCDILVRRGEKCVNGKSIMGVMMLAAAKGVTVEVIADGADEQQALERLEALIQQRFGEDE